MQSSVVKKTPLDASFLSPPYSMANMVVFVATGVAESKTKLPIINGFKFGIKRNIIITIIGMRRSLKIVKI